MKNIFRLFLISVFITIIFTYNIYAGAGTSSALFLNISAGAKPAGMGGSYISLADDVNSIYWNPAGLGSVLFREATFMHNSYVQDLNHEYLAYCQPVEFLKGALGINLTLFDAGNFDRMYIDGGVIPTSGGSFDAQDMSVGLSYGMKLENNINFGGTLKYISSKIDDVKASAFAVDLGVIYKFEFVDFSPIKAGFVIQNLGTKLKYDLKEEDLPGRIKLGISSEFEVIEDFILVPSIDCIVLNEDDEFNISLGSELSYMNNYFLRLGFDGSNDAGSGLTFGLGVKFIQLSLDYAFASYGDLENAHRFSLSYKFGTIEVQKEKEFDEAKQEEVYAPVEEIKAEKKEEVIEPEKIEEKKEIQNVPVGEKEVVKEEIDFDKLAKEKYIKLMEEGYNYFAEGNYDKAIQKFEIAGMINEKSDIPNYNLASIYYSLKKYEEALKEINKALRINPENLENKIYKLYILYKLGRVSEINKMINKLSTDDKQNEKIIKIINLLKK